MNEKNEPLPPEGTDATTDWEALDSRLSAAIQEIESTLEEALTATRGLRQWVERLRTLSAFMKQMETGLVEVRQRLGALAPSRRMAPMPSAPKPLEETFVQPEAGEQQQPGALETAEAAEAEGAPEALEPEGWTEPAETAQQAWVPEGEGPSEPAEGEPLAEGEPMEAAPPAPEGGDKIRLAIESSEANIDLMVVERALRETPGVADVDLLDYAGKRARVQVTLSPGERPQEVASAEQLATSVRERLAKLTWDATLSVSESE
jgi:hypothetical protein